jgi:hypothetical protein
MSAVELAYGDDARSLHVVVRVFDPDDRERFEEVMFDNLTTPMFWLVANDLRPTQEFIGFNDTPEGIEVTPEVEHEGKTIPAVTVNDLRRHYSGSTEEVLFIEVEGDPDLVTATDFMEV